MVTEKGLKMTACFKKNVVYVGLLISSLYAGAAFAVERSCYGRIYAQLLDSGYEINLVNRVESRAAAKSAGDARGQAAENLKACAREWWHLRGNLRNVNEITKLPLSCLNPLEGSIKNIVPDQVDIEGRLIALACTATFRHLVQDGHFAVSIHVETRGDNHCGDKKIASMLIDRSYTVQQCAPIRSR